MKVTSASANKLIRQLNDEKDFYLDKERDNSSYVASSEEEPVIPDYDYAETTAKIREIDEKIANIRHQLNIVNSTSTVQVDGIGELSIDKILIVMAQLNSRKADLARLRRAEPKTRMNSFANNGKVVAEYRYANYDIKTVKKDYEDTEKKIQALQLALDHFNQTYEFDI